MADGSSPNLDGVFLRRSAAFLIVVPKSSIEEHKLSVPVLIIYVMTRLLCSVVCLRACAAFSAPSITSRARLPASPSDTLRSWLCATNICHVFPMAVPMVCKEAEERCMTS
jgi:hypothetical protein